MNIERSPPHPRHDSHIRGNPAFLMSPHYCCAFVQMKRMVTDELKLLMQITTMSMHLLPCCNGSSNATFIFSDVGIVGLRIA